MNRWMKQRAISKFFTEHVDRYLM